MVDSSRTQLASKFLGYKTIYAYSFVYGLSNKLPQLHRKFHDNHLLASDYPYVIFFVYFYNKKCGFCPIV